MHLWSVDKQTEDEFIKMINDKYNQVDSISLSDSIIEMSNILAEENTQDYLSSLIKYNQDSGLEFLEEQEIKKYFYSANRKFHCLSDFQQIRIRYKTLLCRRRF